MLILGPAPHPVGQKLWGWDSVYFNKPSRCFWCMWMFEHPFSTAMNLMGLTTLRRLLKILLGSLEGDCWQVHGRLSKWKQNGTKPNKTCCCCCCFKGNTSCLRKKIHNTTVHPAQLAITVVWSSECEPGQRWTRSGNAATQHNKHSVQNRWLKNKQR